MLPDNYCQEGWPGKTQLKDVIRPYWEVRGCLNLNVNLLLKGTPQVVIPASKQREILAKIQAGHQGIQRSRLQAKQSVWWPGISADIETLIKNCPHCVKEYTRPHPKNHSSQHLSQSSHGKELHPICFN